MAIGLLSAAPAWSQEPAEAAPGAVDSLRHEVERLRSELDSLRILLQRLEAERSADAREAADAAAGPEQDDDPLAAIRAAAAAAVGDAGAEDADTAEEPVEATEPGQFVGRQRSQQALNPEITVTGDLFAIMNADEPNADNFVAREFELSLQSSLDPYTRAKVYVGRHEPGGGVAPFGHGHEEHEGGEPGGAEGAEDHEAEAAHGEGGGVELEEGYAEWVNLPGGLGVTVGKFRQRFGTLNRWHPHALPGQQLPLPYQAFFGEHGLVQTGLSVHWLAPVSGFGTYETWMQFTRSSNERLFGEHHGVSALGHLNAFYELSPATYLELGLTGMAGPGARALDTNLAGVDFTLSWRPPARSLYREATLRGGAVAGRLRSPDGVLQERALGAFAIGEYRLNRRWVLGARWEYTENPLHPEERSWLAAPTLTWWQSEYVRLRAELDYLQRPEGRLRQLLIQTTISMGPHKHETY